MVKLWRDFFLNWLDSSGNRPQDRDFVLYFTFILPPGGRRKLPSAWGGLWRGSAARPLAHGSSSALLGADMGTWDLVLVS